MRRLGQGVQLPAELRERPPCARPDRAEQAAPVPVRPQPENDAGDAAGPLHGCGFITHMCTLGPRATRR